MLLSYVDEKSESEGEIETEEPSELEAWQIQLNPPIDQILAHQNDKYLVKYKDCSYHHLDWLSEEEVIATGRNGKLKLNRFLRDQIHKLGNEEDKFFDPSFLEVDRVLKTTEIFPVVHPRQASLVAERWQGKCANVISKLVNFRKNGFCYAIPFLSPIEINSPGGQDYCRKVRYPIDFTTIHNRLYNGYYTQPSEFWKDLGFLFKNLQEYVTDRRKEIRVVGDTLREIAVHLYKLWYKAAGEDYGDIGPYSLRWVTLVPGHDVTSPEFLTSNVDASEFTAQEEEEDYNINEHHLTSEELSEIDLNTETDKLFLVKWKNLSYTEATWEPESLINNPLKIAEFYRFNRALDAQARQEMIELNNNFMRVLSVMYTDSLSKKSKGSSSHVSHLMRFIDFPKFDFRTQVHQFAQSPSFKDGRNLRDYQVTGLNWLLRNWSIGRNSILADEMGLGKTIQVISFLHTLVNTYKQRGPYLVIAPLSTLAHWKQIIEDWTLLNCVLYHDMNGSEGREVCADFETYYVDVMKRGGTSVKSKLVKFHIMITSFEVFMQDYEKLFTSIPFQLIAIDEAHRLKNKQAKIISFLRKMPCRRYILMTGTPLQNNTEELWSLLNFIEPHTFGSLPEFLRLYGNLENSQQVEQLQANIRPFLLRRLKEEVEKSIPPLLETIIDVELTNVQKTYYRAIYERNRSFLCRGTLTPQLTNMEIQLRKCCNHPYLIKGVEQTVGNGAVTEDQRMQKMVEASGKMVLLDKLLPMLREQNKKALIFSQFTQMLNLIETYLKHHNYKFERLDGSVKASERQASIERFNTEKEGVDIFLLSTRAGGLGINLTSAQVVIIFDSDWNPQNDVQATARAHRIGQTEEVQVYRLVTARTYEAEMFERASRKLGLDQAVFSKDVRGEIENLLRYGAYSLLEDDTSKSQQFFESNIDEILKNKTRVVNYNMIRSNYSFNKSSFISTASDATINVDDPNFWNKVLPPQTSLTSRLYTKLNDRSFDVETQEAEFMEELELAFNEVVTSKLSMESHNLEDEETLILLLSQVTTTKQFSRESRSLAMQWQNELTSRNRSKTKVNHSPPEILSESDEESDRHRRKVTGFGGTGLICAHCEKEGCGWFCKGPCKRGFHTECKDKELDSDHDMELPRNEEFKALDNWGWTCKDCSESVGHCFKCKHKGYYNAEKTQKLIVKCSVIACGKAYHVSCLRIRPKKRVVCPLHKCAVCGSSGNSKSLVQCARCPSAFHLRCYNRKVVRLNKKYLVCHQHKQPPRPPIYPSHRVSIQEVIKELKPKMAEAANKNSYLSQYSSRDEPPAPRKRAKNISESQTKDLYKKYKLPPPEECDYENYERDWCRYCGARIASSFAGGPWGKRMLCMTHYNAWKQKGTLDLSGYPETPTAPIDLSKNTELSYMHKQEGF